MCVIGPIIGLHRTKVQYEKADVIYFSMTIHTMNESRQSAYTRLSSSRTTHEAALSTSRAASSSSPHASVPRPDAALFLSLGNPVPPCPPAPAVELFRVDEVVLLSVRSLPMRLDFVARLVAVEGTSPEGASAFRCPTQDCPIRVVRRFGTTAGKCKMTMQIIIECNITIYQHEKNACEYEGYGSKYVLRASSCWTARVCIEEKESRQEHS